MAPVASALSGVYPYTRLVWHANIFEVTILTSKSQLWLSGFTSVSGLQGDRLPWNLSSLMGARKIIDFQF